MLTRTLMAVLTATLAPVAGAQLLPNDAPGLTPVETGQVAAVGDGHLVFELDTLDMGELFDTETGHLEYKFRNVGTGPLTISHVKPSCGCTIPEMDKNVYEPNETGVIRVDFEPKGKRASVIQTVQVFTDSKQTPTKTLTMRAYVKPIVVLEPNAVLNFMTVEKGAGATQDIRVMGRFSEFHVTRATCDDPTNFDVEILPGGETEVDGETLYASILRVTLKPTARPGQLRTELSIRTNDERKALFSMSAVARVVGDLQFSPARLTLGRVSVGDRFDREIRVTSRSGKPFQIKSASANARAIDASFTFEPVDSENPVEWLLRVTGSVLEPAARFSTMIDLTTDVKDEESSTIQFYGQLRPKTGAP